MPTFDCHIVPHTTGTALTSPSRASRSQSTLPVNPLSAYAPTTWSDALSNAFLHFGANYYNPPPAGAAAITQRRASATALIRQIIEHYCPVRIGFEHHFDTQGSLSATVRMHSTIKNFSAAVYDHDDGSRTHILFNNIADRTDPATAALGGKEDRAFFGHEQRKGGVAMKLVPTKHRSQKIQRVLLNDEEVVQALVVLIVGNSFEFYTFDKANGPRDQLMPWYGGAFAPAVVRSVGTKDKETNVLAADEEDMRSIDSYIEAYLSYMATI